MQQLRVSATDIDQFRYFRAQEDMPLAEFLERMRKRVEPTEQMLAGTALHKALERSKPGEYGRLMQDGYTFEFNVGAEIDIPDIRECKATRVYRIDDCDVTVVGKVDALNGLRIDDHKFTSRFDAERFLSSYQWRIYLEIFGADEFRWNVFEGRLGIHPQPEPIDGFDRQEQEDRAHYYVISAFHPLTTHRYPGMGEDVERELELFVEFARHWLPERFTNLLMAG